VWRKIFLCNAEEVTGGWENLHKCLHDLCSSFNVICVYEVKTTRGGKRVAHMRRRDTYIFVVGKPEGRRPLDRPRRRSNNNIIIDLPEIVSEGLTVIDLACIGTTYWLF